MSDDIVSRAMPSRNNVERVLSATGELGRAAGIDAAAQVLEALADHKRRVVGTGEIKAAAAVLRRNAETIRARARKALGNNG